MTLRIAVLDTDDMSSLIALFEVIVGDGEAANFHPHPFTPEQALAICSGAGEDTYALMSHNNQPIGYGLLRGWDEGYDVPSLGIFVASEFRGTGAALALMAYLHCCAKLKGAREIRLKVHQQNRRAWRLYESLGYQFSGAIEGGQAVGYLRL